MAICSYQKLVLLTAAMSAVFFIACNDREDVMIEKNIGAHSRQTQQIQQNQQAQQNQQVQQNQQIQQTQQKQVLKKNSVKPALANPAAAKCVEDGYVLKPLIENSVSVGHLCINPETGLTCEIWKYYRKECSLMQLNQ